MIRLIAALMLLASSADAENLVVRNDRGGLLQEKLDEVRRLHREGTRVEIRGAVCFSTCTLYLRLPDVCVSPRTTFGFHAPTSYGRDLSPELFDLASRIIAAHYPGPVRDWYLEDARYDKRLSRLSGLEIIRHGVEECDT